MQDYTSAPCARMRHPLSILDLFVVTLVVAVHLFHFPLAVLYHESNLMLLVPLAPTLITIWIHIRARPTVIQSALLHYVICVSWAYLYGYGYALAASRILWTAFRDSPAEMAEIVSKDMAVFAIFSSLLYGIVARCVQWRIRASGAARGSRLV